MFLFRRYPVRVMFVCKANVCRSPMAEGLLLASVKKHGIHKIIGVDSAGTHAPKMRRRPDPRATFLCASQGINIRKLRSRQVQRKDFEICDYLLAMDADNLQWLVRESPEQCRQKISLLGSWVKNPSTIDVPDPYYGSQEGFAEVFTLLQTSVEAFVMANLVRYAGSK